MIKIVLLNFNKLNKNKSTFDFLKKIDKFHKTSQWWILCRNDVETILNTETKYYNMFLNKIIKHAAIDEVYFLTVLIMEDKNYNYNNQNIIYTKWKKYIISMHPATINKITDVDIIEIQKLKSFFIRKVTNNFNFTPIKYNKMLCIITIGTETNQKNLVIFMKQNIYNCDFIIFSFINLSEIKIKLDNVLYLYSIYHKSYYNNVLELCINSKELLKKYINGVLFITEKFNLDLNNNFINNKITNDTKNMLYNTLEDKYKNQAYYTLFFSTQFIK